MLESAANDSTRVRRSRDASIFQASERIATRRKPSHALRVQAPEPADAARSYLDLPSGRLAYTDEGEGVPVVCLHGLISGAGDFSALRQALLRSGMRCILVDLPGYGGSSPPAVARIEHIADIVGQGIAALGLKRPVLVGHSFGAVIAYTLAGRKPELVDRLFLIASPGFQIHRSLRRSGWLLEIARLGHLPGMLPVIGRILAEGFRRVGFQPQLASSTTIAALDVLRNFDFGIQARTWAEIDTPTGVAFALDDPIIENEIQQSFSRRVSPGPRLVFPNGGHSVHRAHASEIAVAIADWTKSAHSAPNGVVAGPQVSA